LEPLAPKGSFSPDLSTAANYTSQWPNDEKHYAEFNAILESLPESHAEAETAGPDVFSTVPTAFKSISALHPPRYFHLQPSQKSSVPCLETEELLSQYVEEDHMVVDEIPLLKLPVEKETILTSEQTVFSLNIRRMMTRK
jgi:hypothetical protein